jgi:hypothetical protein
MKLSILLISTFWVAAAIGALGMDGPPKAPVHETEDEYFGTKIKDPYRWMENIKQDPEARNGSKRKRTLPDRHSAQCPATRSLRRASQN